MQALFRLAMSDNIKIAAAAHMAIMLDHRALEGGREDLVIIIRTSLPISETAGWAVPTIMVTFLSVSTSPHYHEIIII